MRALAFATALAACSHGPASAPPIGNEGSAAPAPVIDAAPADASACVAACIYKNQMRATGPEVIAAECRAECGER